MKKHLLKLFNMNMLLLDRYLIYSFIKKIISVLFIFVTIFLVVDLIEDVDKMLDFSLAFNQYSMIYFYSIPQYINIAFPMTILISTVMTFTLLQKNNEITALKASGISVLRLAIPFIVIGIFSSFAMFYFENGIVTQANTLKSDLEKKYYNKNNKKKNNTNILLQLADNRTIIIDKFNYRNKTAKNVSIQQFNENKVVSRMDIENLIWIENSWFAKNTIYRSFDNENIYKNLPDSFVDIDLRPMDLIQSSIKPNEMDYWSLKSFIERLRINGKDNRKWLVDLYFKIAFPFSNIIMIIFGIALTIKRPRTNFLVGVGSSIFVIFIYYIMIKTGQTAGYSGIVSPLFSVWIANIIFLITGLLLLYRTKS